MAVIRELFERAAEISGRRFPTGDVARESLEGFRNAFLHESTPVNSVMKRVFGHASVREVAERGGEKTFKIFLRSEPAADTIASVVRGLRSGDLKLVARTLGVAPAELGSRSFRRKYAEFARDVFPDVRVAEELAAAKRALPQSLSRTTAEIRPATYEHMLRAMETDRELKRLITRLSEHVGANGGTRFRYVSTFFTLSGVAGTAAAVALALHEQAKRSAGCWRVYLDPVTKELRSCKILQASCRHGEANKGSACDRTPVSFRADMCSGAGPDDPCVQCSSSAEPGSKQHIAESQYLDPNDMYVCRPVASVGEMLGKVIADVPELAHDVAVDVADGVSRVWNSVKYVVSAVVGVLLVLLAVFAFTKIKSAVTDEMLLAEDDGDSDGDDHGSGSDGPGSEPDPLGREMK